MSHGVKGQGQTAELSYYSYSRVMCMCHTVWCNNHVYIIEAGEIKEMPKSFLITNKRYVAGSSSSNSSTSCLSPTSPRERGSTIDNADEDQHLTSTTGSGSGVDDGTGKQSSSATAPVRILPLWPPMKFMIKHINCTCSLYRHNTSNLSYRPITCSKSPKLTYNLMKTLQLLGTSFPKAPDEHTLSPTPGSVAAIV